MSIAALLGRFFRHCIRAANDRRAGIRVDLYDPDYMTDAEISHFLHGRGRCIDWDLVKQRRTAGDWQAPWPRRGSEAGA
jgi:hypothetical protein